MKVNETTTKQRFCDVCGGDLADSPRSYHTIKDCLKRLVDITTRTRIEQLRDWDERDIIYKRIPIE